MLLRRNKKGQAAIFIVLVFQVLFILFAMSLNVAMVVYDKINLQNSLDLAAYYGAKKQAEVLNAMAHINYQMRQNWKLLAWRYRILGTLAQYTGDYHDPHIQQHCNGVNNYYRGDYWCPQDRCNKQDCRTNRNLPPSDSYCQNSQRLFSKSTVKIYPNYCDNRYFICINHNLWSRGVPNDEQNLCRVNDAPVKPITSLPMVAPFLPSAHIAREAVDNLITQVGQSCPLEGALNWLTVQLFLTHFRLDQKDRKVMIKEIYKKTLNQGNDLDGRLIFEGVKKVFYGNLSKANRDNVKELPNYGLQEYQSFQEKPFTDLFGELHVRPILNYLDVTGQDGSCTPKPRPHFLLENNSTVTKPRLISFINTRFGSGSHPMPELFNRLAQSIETPASFMFNMGFSEDEEDPLASLTLSFYKDPKKTLYYGLSTKFDYKPKHQIFSLNLGSRIEFRGSAFAKAFGGSFGPQPEQSDPFIPTQNEETPLQFITNSEVTLLGYVHQPNYSRWPGDEWGLVDRRLHDPMEQFSFLNKHNNYEDTQKVYSIENYFHDVLGGLIGDPLARDKLKNPYTFVRMMEWMAVYPDLYDINHYSILANYHQSYFPKICKLLRVDRACETNSPNSFNSLKAKGRDVFIRGDFGWPDSDRYINRNQTVKSVDLSIAPYFLKGVDSINSNQLEAPPLPSSPPSYQYSSSNLVGNHPNVATVDRSSPPLTRGKLFYPWLAEGSSIVSDLKDGLPGGLLSSWNNPYKADKKLDYREYKFDEKNFLNCDFPALQNMPVPSSCVGLGRTGYSVKLISCDKVKNDSDFKPKPDNIDDYCD